MRRTYQKGFTLVEILVVAGIISLLLGGVLTFGRNVFTFGVYSSDSLLAIQDGRAILKTMVRELRSMSQANTGAYPILSVSTTSITFYTDTDSDNLKEQIRYYIEGTSLKRGVIVPSGSPLTYSGAESLTTLAGNVKNSSSTPLFEYFDQNYAGTSSPLTLPTLITNIHLIKINLMLDVDPNRSPLPRTYTTQVNLRNLKDNL